MSRLFWKIFTWFWLALIAVSVTVGWGIKLYFEHSRQQLENELPQAKVAAIATGIQRFGIEQAIPMLEEFGRFPHPPVLVIDQSGHDVLGRPMPPDILSPRHGDLRVIKKEVSSPRGEHYMVVAMFPGHRHFPPIWRSGYGRLIAIAIALVSSALVCYWLARYIARPLEKLGRASRSLAAGDLSVRVGGLSKRRDEIVDLAEDFNKMAAQIEDLVKARNQLLGDISHELRSPLTRIQVAIALAEEDISRDRGSIESGEPFNRPGKDDQVPGARGRLGQIQKDIDRLEDLIGQILTLSKLETSSHLYLREKIDADLLIKGLVEDARFEAGQKDCHIILQADAIPEIEANEELLRRAVENILRNAVYYTDPGTSVTLSVSCEKGRLQIEITDQGPGVDDKQLESIFEPFVRTDSARERNTGGFGLGMAIAKKAVNVLGGTVSACNLPNKGLSVVISLPLDSLARNF